MSLTGLEQFRSDGARYYDPAAGQFTSADTLLAGLNRYGYVGGDPANATDPSGHAQTDTQEAEVGQAAPSDVDVGGAGVIVLPPVDPVIVVGAVFIPGYLIVIGGYAIYKVVTAPSAPAAAPAGAGTAPATTTPAAGPSGPSDNSNPLGPAINRSTPFYVAETPPPGGGPGPSPVDGVGEQSAPAGPAGDGGMGRGGPGGAPTAGGCEPGGGGGGDKSQLTEFGRQLMQVIQDMGVNLVHGGADVNGYLQWASAAGVTGFDGSGPAETIVQLASWAVDHTVYEEYLHVLNGAERGWTANGSEEMVKEEIAVKRQVLGHADELGMSAAERIGMGQEIDRYLRILRDSAGLVPDDEC